MTATHIVGIHYGDTAGHGLMVPGSVVRQFLEVNASRCWPWLFGGNDGNNTGGVGGFIPPGNDDGGTGSHAHRHPQIDQSLIDLDARITKLEGLQAAAGPAGPPGPAGPRGRDGDPGAQGPAGPPGQDADTSALEAEIATLKAEIAYLKGYKFQQRVLLLDPATGKPYDPPRVSTKRNGQPNIELFGIDDPLDIVQYEAVKKE